MRRTITTSRLKRSELEESLAVLRNVSMTHLERCAGDDEKEAIKRWLAYIKTVNLSTITREDARLEVLKRLGGDYVRTYMLELCISFYVFGGEYDDYEERLVNSLVDGLCLEGRVPQLCELPPEVKQSLPMTNFPATFFSPLALVFRRASRKAEDPPLREYLLSNRHMQMVVLLALANDLVSA